MVYLSGILIFSIGVVVGLIIPDIDSTVRFLTHRSIVTHNFIWPLILIWVARTNRGAKARVRLVTMGLSIALAAHFCFDLFPRSWRGYALIHIPFYGRTETFFSWLWIAISILVCVYIATSLIKQLFDVTLLASGALVSFALMASAEPVGWPLAAFAVAIMIAGIDWPGVKRKLVS